MTTTTNPSNSNSSGAETRGRHIVLIGMMGSGKSSVGRAAAARLGMEFVDLDQLIEAGSGESIESMFRERGEAAFRARERAALRDVLQRDKRFVVATGGGTVGDASNRSLIAQEARSIYLRTSAEAATARVAWGGERAGRPLLAGPDPYQAVVRLMGQRKAQYESADHIIDTDGVALESVVERVVARVLRDDEVTGAGGCLVDVPLGKGHSYLVEMRPSGGAWIAERIGQLCRGGKIGIITDSTVRGLHVDEVASGLGDAGFEVTELVFEPGENFKTLETVGRLLDELLDQGFARRDLLVALGGGVVGDVTGFVAASLLRGVDFVQVPTTTLAAVDSSVGGKTGVNTRHGKNLVGAFHQPKAVLLAADMLRTQTRRAHSAGLVEALKMAATFDAELFADMSKKAQQLLDVAPGVLLPVIARAVRLKAQVVVADEREEGIRAVLNYGHTLGHAIEAGEAYSVLHGEAIALGMVAEAAWADQEGLSQGIADALVEALVCLEAPVDWKARRFSSVALKLDKKRVGGRVRLPIVPALGRFELCDVPMEAFTKLIEPLLE